MIEETCSGSVRVALIPPQNGITYKWSLGVGKVDWYNPPTAQLKTRRKRYVLQDISTSIERFPQEMLKQKDSVRSIEFHPEVTRMSDLFKRMKHSTLISVRDNISKDSNIHVEKTDDTTDTSNSFDISSDNNGKKLITENRKTHKVTPHYYVSTTPKRKMLISTVINMTTSNIELPKKSQELIDSGIIRILEEEQSRASKSFEAVHEDTLSIVDQLDSLNEVIDKNDPVRPLKENDFIDVEEFIKKYPIAVPKSGLSRGQTQRRNLLLWKSLRQAEKELKQADNIAYINKSLVSLNSWNLLNLDAYIIKFSFWNILKFQAFTQ